MVFNFLVLLVFFLLTFPSMFPCPGGQRALSPDSLPSGLRVGAFEPFPRLKSRELQCLLACLVQRPYLVLWVRRAH